MRYPMNHAAHHQVADPALFDADAFMAQILSEPHPIPYLKAQLSETQQRLNERFKQGDDIRTLIYGRAWIIDCILAGIWQRFDWPTEAKLSLMAVGGFGRGELHPYSDIDLLILMDGIEPESFEATISEFLTLLWDINLDIGYSVRTLTECCNEAKTDITIATNLIESRTIVGSVALHEDMYTQVTSEGAWTDKEFFLAKTMEQKARHKKTNNTEYNLEPNLKNSPGGLRDLQTIGWVAKRHFGSTYIRDLVDDGFVTEDELETLNQGELYLWRVRYALHMLSDRHEDRLLFDHQRTLSSFFEYEDIDGKLAVEQFMERYYRTAKSMSEFNSMLLQHFDEAILSIDGPQVITPLNNRFQVHNNYIEVTNDQVFIQTPFALLEIFVLMAQNTDIQGVRASTIRLIRNCRGQINDKFREDIRNTTLFIELLRSPERVTTELNRMNRYGILGLYLPEFGKIIGQMQHDLFHIYTVDAHTLKLIQLTRQFRYSRMREQFPIAHRIVNALPKVELLYIAALYHDIAKGRGGDHSELGAEDVITFCQRHRLGKWDTHITSWLVKNHLLMSMTAQRKDLSDPDVIQSFANHVRDVTHLDYLYVLTIADINATNHTLWNSWRATLMRTLYTETRRVLHKGLENPVAKESLIEEVQAESKRSLEKLGSDTASIDAFWATIGDDYFLRESANNISWHTRAILEHRDEQQPLVLIGQTSSRAHEGATEIFIYTFDQQNLFAASVATLDQLHLSIQDARIILTDNGRALNTFTVLTEDNEPLSENPEYLQTIEQRLIAELDDPEDYPDIIERRVPRLKKLFTMPTTVTFSNDPNTQTTVLEVITPDRPGLLARIGSIFAGYNVSVRKARITSIGERVEDFFYITDQNGLPISDAQLCKDLQAEICEELDAHAEG